MKDAEDTILTLAHYRIKCAQQGMNSTESVPTLFLQKAALKRFAKVLGYVPKEGHLCLGVFDGRYGFVSINKDNTYASFGFQDMIKLYNKEHGAFKFTGIMACDFPMIDKAIASKMIERVGLHSNKKKHRVETNRTKVKFL